jgi:hypothetical protein
MKTLVLSIAICCLFRFALCAAETAPAEVTISSPDAIKVLKLEAGQPRLYDSDPLRVIEKVAAKLAGWQFTSIPQRTIIFYQVPINNKAGVIYAFGGGSSKKPPTREEFLGDDASRWVAEEGAIEGKNVAVCFRRNVVAGETITLQGFELQLAARSIAVETAVGTVGIPAVPPPMPSQAPKEEIDPIIGRWKMGDNIAVFSKNGAAHRFAPNFDENGRWKKLETGKYDIDWTGGREVQHLSISPEPEHHRLMGKDNRGRPTVVAFRVRESDQ